MKDQWQKLFLKLTAWLIVEILLNCLGLDNVADYSEFIFSYKNLCQVDRVILAA